MRGPPRLSAFGCAAFLPPPSGSGGSSRLSTAGCAAFLTPMSSRLSRLSAAGCTGRLSAAVSRLVAAAFNWLRCLLSPFRRWLRRRLSSAGSRWVWRVRGSRRGPRCPDVCDAPGLRRRVPGLPIWVVRVQVQAPVVAFLSAPHLLNLPLVPNPLKAEGRDHHVVLLGAHCCQWLTAAGQGWRAGNAALTADS